MISNPSYQPSFPITTSSNDFLSNEKYQIALPAPVFKSLTRDEPNMLPANYRPTDFDVTCGRGKGSYNRPGNKRFRAIVQQYVPDYTMAKTKFDKTSLMLRIIDTVKAQDNGTARFVSCKKGQWYEITEDKAREKVGHCLRETIAAIAEGSLSESSSPAFAAAAPKQQPQHHLQRKCEQDDLLEQQRTKVDNLLSFGINSNNKKKSQFQLARQQQQQRQQVEELIFNRDIFEL